MKITIEINMNNAAFDGVNGEEVSRLLHELADRVQQENLEPGDRGIVLDYNGNRTGRFEVKKGSMEIR